MRKQGVDIRKIYEYLLKESTERYKMYTLALKMYGVIEFNNLRMIMENPYHEVNYTNRFWFYPITMIDKDRSRRGDYFRKPTAYWFINCEPTKGFTEQQTPESQIRYCGAGGSNTAKYRKKLKEKGVILAKQSGKSGICSEERSIISPDYARNFICDNILGITQRNIDRQTNIFDVL